IAVAAAVVLAGCIQIGNSENLQPARFYVLEDLTPATALPVRAGRTLLLAPTETAAYYDTQQVVFSPSAGRRAYYQFANWTDRPGRRFNDLLLRRLEARDSFGSVAHITAGVGGELMLNTTLEALFHDDAQAPGVARIEVVAELIDRERRRVVARRTFSRAEPLKTDDAEATVAAANVALTALLDELVPWVEQNAAAVAKP
ncbi:MAG: membrane integrity-associated transporter subunit PqiC, partial [Burkholderiales bacterium]|nr:membrane integrity-associated transporter subunit PqiC [Burkholderiales bacterium]